MKRNNEYDRDDNDPYYKIALAKDYNIQLFPLSSPPSSLNISKWKDERLEFLDIAKGLKEILQRSGFTVEKILDCGPSHVSAILGISDRIGEIIYQETKKTTRNIISNTNF
ncbi:MAG: hypothetical protein AB7F53_08585 [Nitrososphaeraceae archaeon]